MKLSGFEVKNERSYTSALICLHEVGWRTFFSFTFLFYVCVCVCLQNFEVGWFMVTYKNSTLSSDCKNRDVGL